MLPSIRSSRPVNETPQNTLHDIASAKAGIERLRVIIIAQTLTTPSEPKITPQSPSKSAKIPDLPTFSDGVDPTFGSWKIQIQGKLQMNSDYFATEQFQIAYVFSRISGDVQKHLQIRISSSFVDPFTSAEDMIQHLSSICENPFRVQNIRRDYRRVAMRVNETFPDFYSRFLHLVDEEHVPKEDLRPDLYDKINLEIQRAIAPTEETLITLQEFQRALRRLDQTFVKSRNAPIVISFKG